VQDDLLGVWGAADATGKPSGSDIRRRKQSYPVVYTLNHGDADARAALLSVYARPEIDDAAVRRAITAMEAAGAREAGATLTASAHAEALMLLEALPLRADVREGLRALVAYLLERDR